MLHGNLSLALAVSLLAHAAALAVPAGGFEVQIMTSQQHQRLPSGQPAGLRVSLAPYSIRPPIPALTDRQQIPLRRPLSAAIDSAGRSVGGLPPRQDGVGTATPDISETSGLQVPRYYLPDEVNERARATADIDLYMESVRDLPGSGSVILTLWINDLGKVDKVLITASDLDTAFEQAIVDQFRTLRFKPAIREHRAVKSLMKIEVQVLPRQRLTRSAASGR